MRASSRPTFHAVIRSRRTPCASTLAPMRIDVVPFRPGDEAAVRHAWEIIDAAARARTPDLPGTPWETFLARMRLPYPGQATERVLALLDGAPAGCGELSMPLLDNVDNATLEVFVDPACRRRGVGRAVHAWAVGRMHETGRKRLTGETVQTTAESDAFAAAMGATAALAETRSRLDVTGLDQDRLDAMLAEAWRHAGGYRFVRWDGPAPERWIDDVAYLDGRLLADAPMGELDWEPEAMDADRIRRSEERQAALGVQRLFGGVEHLATGRLVALTNLSGPPAVPDHLWQNITLVDPPHRGHRLGLVVKLENLRHGRDHRPGLRAIDTFNASSNTHMLAINAAMGFRPVDRWMQWQQAV